MSTSFELAKSLRPVDLRTCTRKDLREYFINAWKLQDILFGSLTTDRALYLNPDSLRNPLIFYLGHPAAFYINRLLQVGLLKKPINRHFEDLFAVGVDPETPEELNQFLQSITWPNADKVRKYRAECFQAVLGAIERLEIELPITDASPAWALLMSIEHDRVHFETSTMLFRQLPVEMLKKPGNWQYAPSGGAAPQNQMISVPGGAVRLGKGRDHPAYGWDNEYGALAVEVAPFSASRYFITNEEYLAFVRAGGYLERRYWDDDSWEWREQHNVTHPKFWMTNDGDFRYRTVFDEIAMPWDWPVEVNHYEAMAYCRWQGDGARLLTEAEWNLIARDAGVEIPDRDGYNVNLKFCSPCPVDLPGNAHSPLGFSDALGNVWGWLADDFRPLPGFAAHPLYEDFSAPFFDDKHSLLVGGCWATTGAQTSVFCRNWFRRYFYQHAGFRVARSL